jgi:hypothetical protein
MWDIRRFARKDQFHQGRRVIIQFRFTDAPDRERLWWLVVENEVSDLCRELHVGGGGPNGAGLWRWLGCSVFAESRRRSGHFAQSAGRPIAPA